SVPWACRRPRTSALPGRAPFNLSNVCGSPTSLALPSTLRFSSRKGAGKPARPDSTRFPTPWQSGGIPKGVLRRGPALPLAPGAASAERPSQEGRQHLARQHVLVDDDLAPAQPPLPIDAPQDVIAPCGQDHPFVLVAVLPHQHPARHR